MSLSVEILNEQKETIPQAVYPLIEGLLNKAAEKEQIVQGEVTVTLVDNVRIQQLNEQFRQLNKPTDVLSFPMDEDDLLGDIIISIPKAQQQAKDYGHSLEREIGFLVVHGFLHLIGYDHQTAEEERDMFLRQEVVLDEYGLFR
jgi:probable rRNA maturation factor